MPVQVTLMGGLANQVFQYAAALSVVGPGNEDQIIADCTLLEAYQNTPGITPRPFQLGALGVVPGRDDGRSMPSYHEDTPWDYDPAKYYHLRGYFQDLKYWAPWIREWFRERIPKVAKRPDKTAAVHIRRGDYVLNQNATAWHGVLPMRYYLDAINVLKQQGIERVSLFSDDPQWCIDALVPEIDLPTSISRHADPWSDVAQMATCSSHIIANSTFSWLGAHLANSDQVIYPKNWLTNNKPLPPIFPENWLCLG